MKTIEPTNQLLLPFLRDSMKSHMLPALAKNLDFELLCSEVNERSIIVFMDPVKFRIVFRNLFSNAIKFSPANSRIEVIPNTVLSHIASNFCWYILSPMLSYTRSLHLIFNPLLLLLLLLLLPPSLPPSLPSFTYMPNRSKWS